ncbi:unnamed protein product, partial [Menidia menidia]
MDREARSPGLGPVRQRRPAQDQQAGAAEGGGEAEGRGPVPPELARHIRRIVGELKIHQAERSWAAEVVNDFREHLMRFLRSNNDQPLFQSAELLTTGSYFEKVKIHSPDEFDMMLKLQVPPPFDTTRLDGGLFYRLDLKRPTRLPIKHLLLENRLTLSSSKILSEMYSLVRKFLKTYKAPDKHCRWEVNKKRIYCPAVTLSLCRSDNNELISVDVVPALEAQAWPPVVRNGPEVDNWLGKKSWRISFSHIEKKIITSHGNKKTCCERNGTKCCRKQCLMLLKCLIASLKLHFPVELEPLCSYHGKTTFLHTLTERYDDADWTRPQLPACFLILVSALQDYVRRGNLPHFFVPECNLFSQALFPRKARDFLTNALEEQMVEGLPLLKPPAPVSFLETAAFAKETTSENQLEKSSLVTKMRNKLIWVVIVALA